jgi:hypothetical protein
MSKENFTKRQRMNEQLKIIVESRIIFIQQSGIRCVLPGHEELQDTSDHASRGYDNYIQYIPGDVEKNLESGHVEENKPADVWVDGVWTHGSVDVDDLAPSEDNRVSQVELVKIKFQVSPGKGAQKTDTYLFIEHRPLTKDEKQQLLVLMAGN